MQISGPFAQIFGGKGSPYGRAGERSETERARTLTEMYKRGDSIALTKDLLIAARRLSGDGLALSVTFGDSSPKGGATGVSVRPTRDEQSLLYPKTVVPCYRGQQLRNNVPCQAAVNLCSRALFFTLY